MNAVAGPPATTPSGSMAGHGAEGADDCVIPLCSASTALENSTRAIEADSEAMNQHHETVMLLHRFIDDMKARMEDFQCPVAPRPRRRRAHATNGSKKVSVRIVETDMPR
jgi:hypothetical protein